MDLASVTGTFAHISTDWIILVALVLLVTVDALRSGASRAIALSLALPPTYLCAALLSKSAIVGASLASIKGVPYAVILLLLLGVFTVMMHRISRDYNSASVPNAILAGLATTALLAVFWMQLPALSALWHFSAPASEIFGSAYALFWLIGSYAALAAVRS
ncbi:MAG: hypothetical protein JWM46_740 [Candidatus Kaiserbacteria bacterium]|nr:hypothetical protein [Candidatus Kaiserbacteria bacterium]